MAELDQNQELIAAVENGDVEEVRRLTNALGADSLELWAPGFNLLCQSLQNKQLGIAKLLINHGCSLGGRFRGDNALHVAVMYGDFEIIKMIKNKGFSSKEENNQGMTPLHLFSQRHPIDLKCPRILNFLLHGNINVNSRHSKSGFLPLHFAAKCGSTEMISLLRNAKCHINGKAEQGRTPLHIAVLNGHSRAVNTLLLHGASHKMTDTKNKTPVCLAVEREDWPTVEVFLKSRKTLKNDAMLIYCATETMNKAIVEMFLKRGASPNNFSLQTGKAPIHIAVEKGSLEIVSLLLQYGANPNAAQIRRSDPNDEYLIGYTALHIAAEREKVEIFQLLLQYGAKPEFIDGKGRTPLHLATQNGLVLVMTALMNCGCVISSLFTPQEPDGYTPLHIAVDNGNKDFVTLFLSILKIPVNSPTKTGFSPLHLAVQKGNTGMVKLLLKYNADPSAHGPTAIETPLFFAAEVGSCEIVEIISEISSNRTGDWQEGYFSLFVAAYHGHEGVVKKLLEKGVDPNANIRNFLTPLQAAAQQGHENIVKILLERQAQVNPKSSEGNGRFSTPLIAACLSGHEAIVEILLNQGADVNVKVVSKPKELKSKVECFLTYGYYSFSEVSKEFKMGYTPIHFATASGKKEVVEMILKRGADVNAEAVDNSTPLCVAVKKQHEDLVSYLLESGASPDAKESGRFILLKAIVLKNVKIVKLLLKYKAPLNFTYRFEYMEDYTPLHLAIRKSSPEVVEVLLKEESIVDTSSDVELPLHCAIAREDEGIISKLIEYGACVDSKCSEGLTPLFHAVADFKIEAFKSLVKLGASLSVKTSKGLSLLHYAIDKNEIGMYDMKDDMIKLTLECGADVNLKDPSNISAFEKVIRCRESVDFDQEYYSEYEEAEINGMFYDHDELLKLFLEEGFDLNTRIGGSAQTILHFAAHTGHMETVKLLLQHNVNVNLLDDKRHTAFHYAVEKASIFLCSILEEIGSEDEDEDGNHIIRGLDSDDFSDFFTDRYISDYDASNLIKNYEQCMEVARIMTKALAKIQASGEDLNSKNLALIKDEFVQHYYNRCNEELIKLKQKKITKYVTYFDVLISNENKLAYYANNISIIEAFESKNLKEFPLYGEDLKARFERGVTRKKLFEMSIKVLNEIFEIEVPCLVIDEIFKYLRSVDLKNLCRAQNPLMFVRYHKIHVDSTSDSSDEEEW